MHIQMPWVLILLPVAAIVMIFSIKRGRAPSVLFPSHDLFRNSRQTFRVQASRAVVLLRIAALLLIVIALSRPQSVIQETKMETEGIDIVLAVDTSSSMLAEDFTLGGTRENRLEVVKDVVKDFISNRHSDRIGLVAFASRAYTVSPLTLDYDWLVQNLDRVRTGLIEDGTAIGSGISLALKRLKDTEAKSKVVILLTDGRNNAGRISPLTAAEAAAALRIKVYTIGAGTKGLAPYPTKDIFGNLAYRSVKIDIDDESLKKIAEKTGAEYFRATDTESLRDIYQQIDEMEKVQIEESGYMEYKELFPFFLIPGLALLILEIVLMNTVLRRIP
jgi:Ca-activated chloride channel family protein